MNTELRYQWLAGENIVATGRMKRDKILSPLAFEELLNDFYPYFDPFKDTCRRLRELICTFRNGKLIAATYESFLGILRDTQAALPFVDDPAPFTDEEHERDNLPAPSSTSDLSSKGKTGSLETLGMNTASTTSILTSKGKKRSRNETGLIEHEFIDFESRVQGQETELG
jgi:hypothetical protein